MCCPSLRPVESTKYPDEADLHALLFLYLFVESFPLDISLDLLFGDSAQREDGARELLLAQPPQEVRLVFLRVHTPGQHPVSVAVEYAGIVAGSHPRTAQAVGLLQQVVPLEQAVAHDAGVGGVALEVFVDKAFDDGAFELVAHIEDVVLDADFLGQLPGLEGKLRDGLSFAGKVAGQVPHAHREPYDFVALFL